MASYCPYCGSELKPEAAPGGLPGTTQCPTCRQEVDLPAAPPALEQGPALPLGGGAPFAGDYVPWEGEGGFFSRLFRTIGQVLAHPVRFFAAPARPGYAWALSFGLILGTFGLAAEALVSHVLGFRQWGRSSSLAYLIFSPLLVLVGLFVYAWITHFCLWIVRGAKNGVRATFRVAAYAEATSVFLIIPVLGPMVGAVWTLVVAIGGLAGAHGIGRWRAFFAIFLPLVLLIFISVAVVVIMLAVGISSEVLNKLRSFPHI